MPHSLNDLAYFIAVTVVLRYVLLGLVVKWLQRIIKRWLIKTERDLIVWTHYKKHAKREGHAPRQPLHCEDERCTEIVA